MKALNNSNLCSNLFQRGCTVSVFGDPSIKRSWLHLISHDGRK